MSVSCTAPGWVITRLGNDRWSWCATTPGGGSETGTAVTETEAKTRARAAYWRLGGDDES